MTVVGSSTMSISPLFDRAKGGVLPLQRSPATRLCFDGDNEIPATSFGSRELSRLLRFVPPASGGDGSGILRRCKAADNMAAHFLPLGSSGARQRHGPVVIGKRERKEMGSMVGPDEYSSAKSEGDDAQKEVDQDAGALFVLKSKGT
nr:GABA transporter 1 [Ipomoea batatas]